MTLAAGDLTTPSRFAGWFGNDAPSTTFLAQAITVATAQIYNKLNRARLFSQNFSRIIEGVGNYQIVLPDWPVTAISQVQIGPRLIKPAPLPTISSTGVVSEPNGSPGWGYRWVPWGGNLPGDPVVLEFQNGVFWSGVQNIRVQYSAGYLIANEAQTVPEGSLSPSLTVLQPMGIWCRDNGVAYAATGVSLTPVPSNPSTGQYVPPPDSNPGFYTFSSGDSNADLLISYSFIPADLEQAAIILVAESNAYRGHVGQLDKSLGGQETIRFLRGGNRGQMFPELPPEVEALIWPYVSTIPPAIGAPV